MDQEQYISHLIYKYILADISDAERQELMSWVAENKRNEETFRHLTDLNVQEWEYHRRKLVDIKRPLADMKARIRRTDGAVGEHHRVGMMWWKIAAACAVVLVVAAIWIHMGNEWQTDSRLASAEKESNTVAIKSVSDITHGETKATLTLDDGTTIDLGANDDENIKAMQDVGAAGDNGNKNLKLSIPRGGEFKVTLEDGTEVWLNAESQLVYPEHFDESERRVQVKGEAYFKVAKNTEKPFYVESAGQLIRVTGTEFNVNSYAEDQHVYTTLVSGSVALRPISGEGGEVVLTPGHQAVYDKSHHKAQLRSVDTAVVTSWVKGSFVFEDQTLAQIMRDLSRWYNFQYQFMSPQAATTEFMGTVPRYGDFHDVLTILEKSGNLKFKIENNKLLIY